MTDVLHVPYTYFPDRTGGTETYVAALARGLRARGLSSAIAAPVDSGPPRSYSHDGFDVHRFGTSGGALPLEDQYGAGDPVAAEQFAAVIERVRPRLVHLHAWTSGISLRLLRAAKAAGCPVVFTYHTPAVSCARGSLMIYGQSVCDGALFVDRCSRCVLQQHGVPLPIGWLLGKLPPAVGRAARRTGVRGRAVLALRMPELMDERHAAFRHLVSEADEIVAVQDWVYELLLFLGAPRQKLVLSRLALPETSAAIVGRTSGTLRLHAAGEPVRLAFFGRLDHTKGAHVVAAAVASLRGLPVSLDLFGAPQGSEGERYVAELRTTVADDPRIRFLPPVPTPDVVPRMREYDAVVVPSVWMETGPLVVPEAMSAGVPVLGSALGGITSFIRHDVDGLLIPAGDVQAWAHAIRRLVEEQGFLARLTAGVRPPETMDRIVDEMVALYSRRLAA